MRRWFRSVCEGYVLEEHHIKMLVHAAECWDRATEARRALEKHGLTFVDRFGCPRSRPEAAIERDQKIIFSRLVRELDLDQVPTPEPGRLPLLARNRR
jgi:hypothetical protein